MRLAGGKRGGSAMLSVFVIVVLLLVNLGLWSSYSMQLPEE
jgi:hypothetical protein